MKQIYLFLALLTSFNFVQAQCEAPEIKSWDANDETNINLSFMANDDAESYILTVELTYFQFVSPQILTFEGEANAGMNSIVFDISEVFNSSSYERDRFYYQGELQIVCSDDQISEKTEFYFSPHSLINNSCFEVSENFVQPLQYLGHASFPTDYSAEIEVTPNSGVDVIDDMYLFADIGQSDNASVFFLTLTSPAGTSINLVSPLTFARNQGISAIFHEGSPYEFSGDEDGKVRGIFHPAESFSAFFGEDPTGTWTVTVTMYSFGDDGYLGGLDLVFNQTPRITNISGKAYYDLNADGTQDEGEDTFPVPLVYNSISNSYLKTEINGLYSDCSSLGSGQLTLENTPKYYSAEPIVGVVSEGQVYDQLNFNLIPTADVEDLKIDMFTLGADIPGNTNTYRVKYTNVGTQCVSDIDIAVSLDALLEIVEVSDDLAVYSNNTLSLSIDELCPNQFGIIEISTSLDELVPFTTILNSTAAISHEGVDENTNDNLAETAEEVVDTQRLNSKQVSHSTIDQNFIEDGQPLKYTIRFEREETFLSPVGYAHIGDAISENLDVSSLVITDSSHPNLDLEIAGNSFLIIRVSDLGEEQKGFIRFEVKPNGDLQPGDVITNMARRTFAYSIPRITNTVTTIVENTTSVSEFQVEAGVSPNPVQNTLSINWSEKATVEYIEVFDVGGRKVELLRISNELNNLRINVSNYPSGLYFLHFESDDLVKPVKWIKL